MSEELLDEPCLCLRFLLFLLFLLFFDLSPPAARSRSRASSFSARSLSSSFRYPAMSCMVLNSPSSFFRRSSLNSSLFTHEGKGGRDKG